MAGPCAGLEKVCAFCLHIYQCNVKQVCPHRMISTCISFSFLTHFIMHAALLVRYLRWIKKNPAYGRQRISRPMRIVGPILLKFFIKNVQVMDVLFEETDKPVRLLEEHVHHLQFPDEKSKAKQSQSVSSKSTSFLRNLLMIKCNSMRFSQEIAGEGCTLRGDKLG